MEPEHLAAILLLAPDFINDEDLLLLILADCDKCEPPVHYKYPRL